jgi:hypothetical protein
MENDFKFKLVMAASAIWLIAGATANRFGYLITAASYDIRGYIIFPALILCWYFFVFAYKRSSGSRQLTAHQINLKKYRGYTGRSKLIIGYVLGIPLVTACCAWLTIGVPAWLTLFLANKPYAHEYIYTPEYGSIKYYFKDTITDQAVFVRVTPKLYESFPNDLSKTYVHKIVCLKGRTSAFGTIVERIDAGACSRMKYK